jgi:purine-binding chemotaxis protein CheW
MTVLRGSSLPARDGGHCDYLAFGLADENYALPLVSVREIMAMQPVTEVPRAPRTVLGIFSVRGGVTTLIDMRKRLRVREAAVTPRARVLLVDGGAELVGFLVDRVDQVYRLATEEIELAADIGGDLSDHVVGIGRPGTRAIDVGEHARVRGRHAAGSGSVHDILILLDPVSLLKL